MEENSGVSREMPKYQSHKKVWALKIKHISYEIGKGTAVEGNYCGTEAIITPEEEGYDRFGVSNEYINKHKPFAGGYYVVYEDGYKSFSPSDVFIAGNTKIS